MWFYTSDFPRQCTKCTLSFGTVRSQQQEKQNKNKITNRLLLLNELKKRERWTNVGDVKRTRAGAELKALWRSAVQATVWPSGKWQRTLAKAACRRTGLHRLPTTLPTKSILFLFFLTVGQKYFGNFPFSL